MRNQIALALAFLSLAACSSPSGTDAGEEAGSTASRQDATAGGGGGAVTSAAGDRFAFASPSLAGEQGAPGNEDVTGIGPWVLEGWGAAQSAATDQVLAAGKTPYVYLYLVAGTARARYGYQDCNVGAAPEKTLCHGGAAFLRDNANAVVTSYAETARALAGKLGSRTALVHVEPDWFQYVSKEQTAPLSYAESTALMNRVLGAIQQGCPSCRIVADISPWCPDLKAFMAGWDLDKVSFGGLVGKYFAPTTGKIDSNTYAQMREAVGKPLIVSNAYGAGGGAAAYPREWDDRAAVEAVAQAGVAMVMQPNTDRSHYALVISGFTANPVRLGGIGAPLAPAAPPAPGAPPQPGASAPVAATAGDYTFTRSPNVNAYWAEVTVAAPAGAQVSKVEAIVDQRTWHALSLQPWGAWGGTFHVPAGSSVVFRAWDQAGVAHDSPASTWP